MQEKLEQKTKTELEQESHLANCEDCGCLIHIDVYNLHKKLYNKGVCGICLGLTEYSQQMRAKLHNKK